MTEFAEAAPVAVGTFAALGLAATLTEPMRRVALRYGFTDRPAAAAHKAHARTTPYLGGVAVVVATLLPVVGLLGQWNLRLLSLVGAGLLIAVLGLVDDLRTLPPRFRLVIEAVGAITVVACGNRVHLTGFYWPDAILTVAWIVVLTNSFNLLDNMDGAAASTAGGISLVLAGYALVQGYVGTALLLGCLAAACGGFLCHNWHPARIFMGDAGSLFIGFVISTASVRLLGTHGGGVNALTSLALVTFVPVVDTTLVLISRFASGRSWCEGGTDHVSHRLRRLGMQAPQVALVLLTVAGVSAFLGVLVAGGVLPAVKVLAGGTGTVATAVALLLRVPVYTDKPRRTGIGSPATRTAGAASAVDPEKTRTDRPRVKAPSTRRRKVHAGQ